MTFETIFFGIIMITVYISAFCSLAKDFPDRFVIVLIILVGIFAIVGSFFVEPAPPYAYWALLGG